MTRIATLALIAAALTGCAASNSIADGVNRRAARSVVVPVLQNYMTAPQAEIAADCVIANASPAELGSLARDVGVRAGTLTVQNVVAVVRRPATGACMRERGVSMGAL